jgi:chromosome segregation ATPase
MDLESLKGQLTELDKKLVILINSVQHDNETVRSSIVRVEKDISDIQTRLRTIELQQASEEANREDFKTVKNSIIRIVVSSMFGIITAAGIFAAILIKVG